MKLFAGDFDVHTIPEELCQGIPHIGTSGPSTVDSVSDEGCGEMERTRCKGEIGLPSIG